MTRVALVLPQGKPGSKSYCGRRVFQCEFAFTDLCCPELALCGRYDDIAGQKYM